MADALKFMIELVDRMTAPATRVAMAIKHLDSNLLALKRTVGELSAMGAIKLPSVSGGVGKGAGSAGKKSPERDADAHVRARLKHEQQLAREADKAAKAQQKQLDRQIAAREKHDERQLKLAQRASEKAAAIEKRTADRAAKEAQRASEKAADKQMKLAQRGQREVEKAQKIAQKNIAKKALAEQEAAEKYAAAQAQMGTEFMALAGGAAAAATAVLALGAAFGALVLKGANIAIEASEAKNDTLDMLEAMLGTQAAAQETYAALEGMAGELATSQAELGRLAQELSAAGVDNQTRLLSSVKAIAQVESVLKGAGGKVQGIIEKAVATGAFQVEGRKLAGTGIQIQKLYAEIGRRMGIGVKEVEAQMKAGKISAEVGIDALNSVLTNKFDEAAGKQAMDFGAQMQRLRDNIGKLFEDVNTGPFTDGLAKIVGIFDKSTVAGAALQHVLTTTFDGLFAAAGKVLPYVTTFLKGLVLMGLKVWNALRPLGKAISQAFGGESADGPKSFSDAMIKAATAVGDFTAKVVGLLTQKGVWESIVFAVNAVAAAIGFLWNTMTMLIGAFVTVEGWIVKALTWFADLGTAVVQTGNDIINGLIAVLSDPSRLYGVVTNLAQGALNRFKEVFGIHSDSKEMMKLGGHLTGGLATGIDNGAKAANDNMANVVSIESARARAVAPAAATAGAAASGGGGVTIELNFGENAISINGANLTMEEVREQFPSMFADAVELMLLSQGGGASVGRTGS